MRYRAALVKLQTTINNRVQAILFKRGYQCPYADAFGKQGRAWLTTLALRLAYQQALHGLLAVLDTPRIQIRKASRIVDQYAVVTPLAQQFCTLPGGQPLRTVDGRGEAVQAGGQCDPLAIWKMLLVVEGRFRRLNPPEPMKRMYLGIEYQDGGRGHQAGGRHASPVSTPVDSISKTEDN